MTRFKLVWLLLGCLLLGGLALAEKPPAAESSLEGARGPVYLLKLTGGIDPFLTNYLISGLDKAKDAHAEAVIIQIDTPGGLLKSTMDLIQAMLASPVPVVTWVAPPGAGAGSAGAIIALAGNVIVMAEGTNIGAAHPVSLAPAGVPGQPQEAPDESGVMEKKVVNFTASYVKSIAEQRGRSQQWAEQIVRESRADTASEALKKGIADFLANNLTELLDKLDGRTVKVPGGTRTLHTRGASVEVLPMSFQERFLHSTADPNVAYLLLTIGIMALIYELASPGGVVAGTVGVICLLLGLTSLAALEVNLGGLLLIVVAIILFVLDLKVPSHGVLTAGGIVALTLGSMMLLSPEKTTYPIGKQVIFTVVGVLTLFFVFAIGAVVKAMRRKPIIGREGYVGATAEVRKRITADSEGVVFLDGTLWAALSETGETLEPPQRVQVVKLQGLKLLVKPLEDEDRAERPADDSDVPIEEGA